MRNQQRDSENVVIVKQGDYSFTGDDGQVYSLQYVADDNGFQPQGAHLPVAPAIPELIAKALDYIAQNPQVNNERRF